MVIRSFAVIKFPNSSVNGVNPWFVVTAEISECTFCQLFAQMMFPVSESRTLERTLRRSHYTNGYKWASVSVSTNKNNIVVYSKMPEPLLLQTITSPLAVAANCNPWQNIFSSYREQPVSTSSRYQHQKITFPCYFSAPKNNVINPRWISQKKSPVFPRL